MAQCLSPITINRDGVREDTFPCGKCPQCTARKVSGWSFRLMQHLKTVDTAYFITLTYDTEHVPLTNNGFMNLSKRDLQLFFKRLRKAHDKYNKLMKKLKQPQLQNIKYYACGEYGSKYNRPHYHVILFNAKLDLIQNAWGKGYIHYGMDVNEASVGYTLKYMCKPSRIPLHRNDDRHKEFPLMSKKLGLNYVTPKMIRWHNQSEDFMHCILPDGKKIAMPRYYKQKIYDEYTRIMFGKLGFEKMQSKKNEALSKYVLTDTDKRMLTYITDVEKYDKKVLLQEEKLRQAKNYEYKKQIKKSADRQKNF